MFFIYILFSCFVFGLVFFPSLVFFRSIFFAFFALYNFFFFYGPNFALLLDCAAYDLENDEVVKVLDDIQTAKRNKKTNKLTCNIC